MGPPPSNSNFPVGRFSATQLCVLSALGPGPQATKGEYNRRPSQSFPSIEEKRDAVLDNYLHGLPSVLYLDANQLSHHERVVMEPRRRIFYYWKNLAGVSVSILCLLVAYNSFFYVQSSLYSHGMGSIALAVDYAAQVISCTFVPAVLMRRLGCKWTLFVSMFCISLYLAANLYAKWWTLIPAAAIMGLGFAAMWATMNTMVSHLATGYARLKGLKPAATVSRFFGLFYMTIETAKIWGNLISSAVLAPPSNQTYVVLPPDMCGAAYCNQELKRPSTFQQNGSTVATVASLLNVTSEILEETTKAPMTQVYILGGIALGIALLSLLLVAALLSPLKTQSCEEEDKSACSKILSTIRLLSNRDLQLLIIITIDVGLVQSFFVSDFTKAFVTCSLGIHRVGVVTTCYGLTTVLGSLGTGYLAQLIGRPTLVVGAVVLNIGDLLLMLFWTPNPNQIWVYYVIAGIWGIALSVWLTQLSALYARVFKDKHEDAFSNHRLWECIGFVIGFAWAQYLCMPIKIYISLFLLVLGLIGYVGVEISLRRAKKKWQQQNMLNHY